MRHCGSPGSSKPSPVIATSLLANAIGTNYPATARLEPRRRHNAVMTRAVVLVEGISDRLALEALAARRGRDLDAEGISVIAMGGAHAVGGALRSVEPGVRIAGLCDAGEEDAFRRALEANGVGAAVDRAQLEALGFYVCDADLEDELVRAVG